MNAPRAHRHMECVMAGDCNAKGWCFGQACDLTVPEQPVGHKVARERCLTCRRRIRNQQIVQTADPTVRYPEGLR